MIINPCHYGWGESFTGEQMVQTARDACQLAPPLPIPESFHPSLLMLKGMKQEEL